MPRSSSPSPSHFFLISTIPAPLLQLGGEGQSSWRQPGAKGWLHQHQHLTDNPIPPRGPHPAAGPPARPQPSRGGCLALGSPQVLARHLEVAAGRGPGEPRRLSCGCLAGHTPGPGWLEAPWARLPYARGGKKPRVTAAPRETRTAAHGASPQSFLSAGPPSGERSPRGNGLGTDFSEPWEHQRTLGGGCSEGMREQPDGEASGGAQAPKELRSPFIPKATRGIFIFKKPTAWVARLR